MGDIILFLLVLLTASAVVALGDEESEADGLVNWKMNSKRRRNLWKLGVVIAIILSRKSHY